MIIRRLLVTAVLGCCFVLLSLSACLTVKAPETITIGDSGRNHSDQTDNRQEHDREDDDHDDDDDDDHDDDD